MYLLVYHAFPAFSAKLLKGMVGPGGLEPLTSSVSRKRSNQLSYGPTLHLETVYQSPGDR